MMLVSKAAVHQRHACLTSLAKAPTAALRVVQPRIKSPVACKAVKSNTPAPDAAESDEELQLSPEELELMSALDNDVEQEDADDEAAPLDDADAWEIDEETLAQLDREGLLMDESSEDDIQEEEEDATVTDEAARAAAASQASTSYAAFDTDDDEDSREFATAMARVASDTKGGDVMLLHVAPLVYWTSYMLVVTVFSRPQLNAMLVRMEKAATEQWKRQLPQHKKPGRGMWEVLDYGDVVVHVMTAEEREYYDIESFYGAAEEVDLPFLKDATPPEWTTRAQ